MRESPYFSWIPEFQPHGSHSQNVKSWCLVRWYQKEKRKKRKRCPTYEVNEKKWWRSAWRSNWKISTRLSSRFVRPQTELRASDTLPQLESDTFCFASKTPRRRKSVSGRWRRERGVQRLEYFMFKVHLAAGWNSCFSKELCASSVICLFHYCIFCQTP